MKIWKLNYNEETKKVEVCAFDVLKEIVYTPARANDVPKTNLVEEDNGFFLEENYAILGADHTNLELENGMQTIKCKDCGRFFFVTEREAEWFTSKDLKVPKRCVPCRKKHKREREGSNDVSI